MTHQAEPLSQSFKEEENLTSWTDGKIPLAKGARTKRPNPNFEQRKEQEELRELVLLQGGNPGAVTRLPPSRRGSRGGGRRLSRQESLAAEHERELKECLQKGVAEVYHLEDYRQAIPGQQGEQSKTPTVADVRQPMESPAVSAEVRPVQVEDPDPFYWSRPESYSPEAIEQRRREDEAKRLGDAECRAARAEMEAAVNRVWQKTLSLYRSASGVKQRQRQSTADNDPTQSDAEGTDCCQAPDCVSHLQLKPEETMPVEPPGPRMAIGSSHNVRASTLKARKTRKEKKDAGKAAVRLVKEAKQQLKDARQEQRLVRANRQK